MNTSSNIIHYILHNSNKLFMITFQLAISCVVTVGRNRLPGLPRTDPSVRNYRTGLLRYAPFRNLLSLLGFLHSEVGTNYPTLHVRLVLAKPFLIKTNY